MTELLDEMVRDLEHARNRLAKLQKGVSGTFGDSEPFLITYEGLGCSLDKLNEVIQDLKSNNLA